MMAESRGKAARLSLLLRYRHIFLFRMARVYDIEAGKIYFDSIGFMECALEFFR